jgi:hypothetical protein
MQLLNGASGYFWNDNNNVINTFFKGKVNHHMEATDVVSAWRCPKNLKRLIISNLPSFLYRQ